MSPANPDSSSPDRPSAARQITTLYTPDSQDPEDNIVPRLLSYQNYIINELLVNLDKDKVSGMVLIDYRKAFDMVDHARTSI